MKIGSSSASLPNPTPILFLITAIAILAWPDSLETTALAVAIGIVVPAALVGIANSPQFAIVLLIVAAATPRLFVDIGGLKARPEHLVGGLMICALPFIWRKSGQTVQWIWPDYWLMAYIGLFYFSSIFMSSAPGQTIKWATQQLLAILPYFFLRLFITDRARFRWAFRALLVVGVVTCGYAIACFYSYIFLGTSVGVEVEQYVTIAATYGLQFEANILGGYSGALAVMLLVMYLWEGGRKYLIGCTFFGLIAMAASLSRAPLAATFLGFVVVAFFAYRRGRLTARATLNVAAASLAALMLVGPLVLQHYTERFSTVEIADPTADPNTLTRAVQTFSALEEVASHPIFGGGIASFQLAFNWQQLGAGWEDQGWIGNTELRVLHDTGATGLIAFGTFVGGLVVLGWKAFRRESSPELIALLAAGVVYAVTFQATEGTLLAFPWVHLGLIGCGISAMTSEQKRRHAAGEIAPSLT